VIELCEKLVINAPSLPMAQVVLGYAYHNLGICYENWKLSAKSIEAYQRSCQVREKLMQDFPANREHTIELAESYCNMGNVYLNEDNLKDAHAYYDKAEVLLRGIMH